MSFQPIHGLRNTPEYDAWARMIQRCTNPNNKDWGRYGGRGIKVCDEWLSSFQVFDADMGQRPSPGHSLDRIDNELGYQRDNCRWATHDVQCNNRSKRPGTSQYVGVCKTKSGKWRAQIGTGKNKKHLGTFNTEEEAATAVEKAKNEQAEH